MTIKNIFYKSTFLIVFFAAVSAVTTLTFSTFINNFKEYKNINDFLSEEYMSVNIQQDGNVNCSITLLKDFLSDIDSKGIEYIFYKENSVANGKGVIYNKKAFEPKLIYGRNFNNLDFLNGTKTIIVEQKVFENCMEKNGKRFYTIDNEAFEVIGIFKNDDTQLVEKTLFYYNLSYFIKNTSGNTFAINGNYLLDSGNNTFKVISDLSKYLGAYKVMINAQRYLASDASIIKQVIGEAAVLYIAFGITIFLLILNTFSAIINWLNERRKEIAIRKMCGANIFSIEVLISKDFLILITTSFIIGLFAAKIIVELNLATFTSNKLDMLTFFIAYFSCLLMGAISGFTSIQAFFKREIINILR